VPSREHGLQRPSAAGLNDPYTESLGASIISEENVHRYLTTAAERPSNRSYDLQTVSGETLPALKGALVGLILGRSAQRIWVFVGKIKNTFLLVLEVLRTQDREVDFQHRLLRMDEEVSLWRPELRPRFLCCDNSVW
jgi:hypothetical protein